MSSDSSFVYEETNQNISEVSQVEREGRSQRETQRLFPESVTTGTDSELKLPSGTQNQGFPPSQVYSS